MEMVTSLQTGLAEWDGKSVAIIKALYQKHSGQSDFIISLLSALKHKDQARGASWCLKNGLESGVKLSPSQSKELVQQLETKDQMEQAHWETRLHLLQCLPYLAIPASEKENLLVFIRSAISAPEKFVRAWGYNALYVLAGQFPELRQETQVSLQAALEDQAPSVRARVRTLLKNGFA